MKHWRSTLIGAVLASSDLLLSFTQDPQFDWSNPANYLRPVLIVALGAVVADAKKSLK